MIRVDRYILFVQATLIDPCIKGTLNVLRSCSRASRTVKRVVLTSSCSSIRYRDDANQISPLNESHWSDPDYCKRHKVIILVALNMHDISFCNLQNLYLECKLHFIRGFFLE